MQSRHYIDIEKRRAEDRVAAAAEASGVLEVRVEHKDLNHVYYNATLFNPNLIPIKAALSSTSTVPLVSVPKDFELSVIRFDVGAQTIPITIVDVIPLFTDPAGPLIALDLTITLTTGGIDYPAVIFINPEVNFFDRNIPFGSVFKIQALLDDINTAFAAAFAAIPVKPPGSTAPMLIWNPESELIELFVSSDYMSPTAVPPLAPPTIEIWVSYPLYELIEGFSAFTLSYFTPFGKDVQILVRQSEALLQPAVGARTGLPFAVANPGTPPTLLKVRQEAKTTPAWNGARSLLLTSSMLPVRGEYVPASVVPGTANSSQLSIISDFLVPSENNPIQTRNVFQYIPNGEYRMIDMVMDTPINTVDIAMFWTDFLGNVYPLTINHRATFSVKILFRRKGITD